MTKLIRRIWTSRKATSAVEYGFIVALIVIVMVTALQSVASATVGMWGNVSTVVNAH